MPLPPIQVRNLGQGGILTDVAPNAPPLPYWSNGRNIVFENGQTIRAPIWREVFDGVGTNIRAIAPVTPSSGAQSIICMRDDGSLLIYSSGAFSTANPTGFTSRGYTQQPWTSCQLGDVVYVNRPDYAPLNLLPTATQFAIDPQWNANTTCNVLRQWNDSLVAIGINTATANYPTEVLISGLTLFGETPSSWDTTGVTSSTAYSNQLAQLDGPILDGLTLEETFILYTAHELWQITAGGSDFYSFRKVFADDGIIGTNCVVEVDGLHYVFGSRDIYVTDGNSSKTSLAEGSVRKYIYSTVVTSQSYLFFAFFSPKTNEVWFCYVSNDPNCAYANPTGCNSAVVYSLATKTFSFIDLPNVTSMCLVNVDIALTWQNCGTRTWNTMGGNWLDLVVDRDIHSVGVQQPLASYNGSTQITSNGTLIAYDYIDSGNLNFPYKADSCAPAFVQRTGISLDATEGIGASIRQSKLVRSIYPEINVSRPVTVQIRTGSQMTADGAVTWNDSEAFDPINDYKVDPMITGRYLAVEFEFNNLCDGGISGFDLDIISNGNR